MTPKDLANALPLEKGDTVLLASNVEQLIFESIHAGREFDLNEFIDCLQERVGKAGTLLFPTYNWDFCHGTPFDYRKTPSKTGTLSSIALKRSDFRRSRHPIYSWAIWGRDQAELCALDNTNSFVGNTPFDYLYRINAKFISLDVNLTRSFTFVHYVEEKENVPYRFKKNFTADYIDENGQRSTRTASMYVRFLDRTVIVDFSGYEQALLERNLMSKTSCGGVVIRVLTFGDAYNIAAEFIRAGDYAKIAILDE